MHQPQTLLQQPIPKQQADQKEEEQPWIEVKRHKQKPNQEIPSQEVPKRGKR